MSMGGHYLSIYLYWIQGYPLCIIHENWNMLYSSSNFQDHSTYSSTKVIIKKMPTRPRIEGQHLLDSMDMTSYDWMLTFHIFHILDQESKANISWAFSFWSPFSSKCLKTSWKLRDFGELVWSLTRMDGLVWKSWENHGNHQDSQDPTVWIPTFWTKPYKKNMAWLRSYYFSPMVLKHFRPRRIRIIRDQKTAPVKVPCAWDIPGRSLSVGHNFCLGMKP